MAAMAINQGAPGRRRVVEQHERRELWCSECGYGVVATVAVRCPMCGGSEWQETPLRRHRER